MIHYASVQKVEMAQPNAFSIAGIKFMTAGKDVIFGLTTTKEMFSTYNTSLQQLLPGRVFLK